MEFQANQITLTRRDTSEKIYVSKDEDIVSVIKELLEKIQKDMYDRAVKRRDELTFTATNMDELRDIMENHPGFTKAMWCGDSLCEEKIKEIKGCKSRCIPEVEEHISDVCVCCGRPAKHMVYWDIQY